MKKAFTLVELMVTVVILAILVALAIPTYMRVAERAKQRGALATLATIYSAEKRFRSERQTFGQTPAYTNNWGVLNIDNINNPGDDFTYTFTSTQWQSLFTAIATRTDGPFENGTIGIDQDRTITQNYNP